MYGKEKVTFEELPQKAKHLLMQTLKNNLLRKL